jgi:hypothetical protein
MMIGLILVTETLIPDDVVALGHGAQTRVRIHLGKYTECS